MLGSQKTKTKKPATKAKPNARLTAMGIGNLGGKVGQTIAAQVPKKPQPAAAPGTPTIQAPTAAQQPAILPFNAAGETDISNLQKSAELALGGVVANREALRKRYFGTNADGTPDPYSLQQELLRQAREARSSAHLGAASQGQLYSGSSELQQALLTQDQDRESRRLQDDFTRQDGELISRKAQIELDRDSQIASIKARIAEEQARDVRNTPVPATPAQPQSAATLLASAPGKLRWTSKGIEIFDAVTRKWKKWTP